MTQWLFSFIDNGHLIVIGNDGDAETGSEIIQQLRGWSLQIENDFSNGQTTQIPFIALEIIAGLSDLKNTGVSVRAAALIQPILKQIITLIALLRNGDKVGAEKCNIEIKKLLDSLIEKKSS